MNVKFTITKRILTIILVIAIIPTTVLGFLNYQNANKLLLKEIKGNTVQSLGLIKEIATLFMDNTERDLAGIQQQTALFASNNTAAMTEYFQNYQNSHPYALNVYFSTTDKQFTVYPSFDLPAGFDPTSRVWYTDAVQSKGTIWTEPYIDTSSKQLVVSVAAPVYNGQVLLGVLGIDVSLGTLSQIVSSTQLGDHGYVLLTDTQKKIIAHPDSAMLGEELPHAELSQALTAATGDVDYQAGKDKRFSEFVTLERTGWKIIGDLSYEETKVATAGILNQTIISSIIATILAIIFGLFMSNTITAPLKMVVKEAALIGSGDFTVRSNTKARHEVGILSTTLNSMVDDLNALMLNIKNTAFNLSSSAESLAANAEETSASTEEVTATIGQISQGASNQANATEQGNIMVHHMDERLKGLQSRSDDMLHSSQKVNTAKEQGIKTISSLRTKTDENKASVNKISSTIQALNDKSTAIGAILTTINDIASQTNLLALNAAIEAARAGEAGRGFAVVSDEIRKLAEQSAESTEDIRTIIEDIQQESNHAVRVMNEVLNQTEEQESAVQEVNLSFDSISNGIQEITEKITQISRDFYELSQNSQELVSMISTISSVSEETAAASEEVTASMEQTATAVDTVAQTAATLNSLAEKLTIDINRFKIQ